MRKPSECRRCKFYTDNELLVCALHPGVACEFIEGQAVPKRSPKRFHADAQKASLILMDV